jgi:KAP family P-loop domain/Clp amino terminal domain, pathogenicity island component
LVRGGGIVLRQGNTATYYADEDKRREMYEFVAAGAPVLVDDRLVAVLTGERSEGTFPAVSVRDMADEPGEAGDLIRGLLPPGRSGPQRVVDESLFGLLSISAKQALERAEGIRLAIGQDRIHMEHLMFALFLKEGGPTRRLFERSGINESILRELIRDAVKLVIPRSWGGVQLTSLPPRSAHVQSALAEARATAEREESPAIKSRHLLYGALSVDECGLVGALRDRGVRKEDIELAGVEETEPSSPFDLNPRAIADQPTSQDSLNLKPLVDGLYSLLDSRDTRLPLAIAVTAPWGEGKSSVMLQLERRLTKPPQGVEPYRRWHTVWFEAWKYEQSERLWAALAKAVYEQPQRRMNAFRRVLFRIRVERRRQTLLSFLLKGVGPPLVTAGVAAVTASNTVVPGVDGILPAGTALATFVASSGRFWGLLSQPFKRAIDSYVDRPRSPDRLGFTPEANADVNCMIDALLKTRPDPEEKEGPFPPLVRFWRRIRGVLRRFALVGLRRRAGAGWASARKLWSSTRGETPALIVFVDDLDRCNTRHVVETVEAINQIFNGTPKRQCVFMLGMDRDVVSSAIDVAYADTIAFLEKRQGSLSASFGLEFLTKLVQISVAIPQPELGTLVRLLATATRNEIPPDGVDPPPALVEDMRRTFLSAKSLAEVDEHKQELLRQFAEPPEPREKDAPTRGGATSGTTPTPEQGRAAARVAAQEARSLLLRSDSPEVWRAEREAVSSGWLGRNPRRIKRFDNAYRLQLHVASNSGLDLRFDPDQLAILAKWVSIRLRWPALAMAVDADRELLMELETYANQVEAERGIPDRWRERPPRWFADQSLIGILREENEHRWLSKLSDAFLNVT